MSQQDLMQVLDRIETSARVPVPRGRPSAARPANPNQPKWVGQIGGALEDTRKQLRPSPAQSASQPKWVGQIGGALDETRRRHGYSRPGLRSASNRQAMLMQALQRRLGTTQGRPAGSSAVLQMLQQRMQAAQAGGSTGPGASPFAPTLPPGAQNQGGQAVPGSGMARLMQMLQGMRAQSGPPASGGSGSPLMQMLKQRMQGGGAITQAPEFVPMQGAPQAGFSRAPPMMQGWAPNRTPQRPGAGRTSAGAPSSAMQDLQKQMEEQYGQ